MAKFTLLDNVAFVAHSLSIVFVSGAIVLESVKNRVVLFKSRPAQLLFTSYCFMFIFHLTGLLNGYISAVSMEQQDSMVQWTEKMLGSVVIFKSSVIILSSMLLGVFSYTWTTVNALLPDRKLAKFVSSYATLIVPIIFVFISIFLLVLIVVVAAFSQQAMRCYFAAFLTVGVFQILIGLLLIPIIIDVTTTLVFYVKSAVARNGVYSDAVDNISFALTRLLVVAYTLLAFMILSGYLNYKDSDISFILSPLPSPNKYDIRKTVPFTQVSTILFGFGGFIASFLTLGKLKASGPSTGSDHKTNKSTVTDLKNAQQSGTDIRNRAKI
ncbi:hypothetical protein HDV02_001761 [Globomyces sp. JEL0801]|nr:hypothetical protein HDV02_001761 [Globomyces sp. JEL0801]